MAHVFISYKRENSEFAKKLRQKIETAGFKTWMDSDLRAGVDWRYAIDTAIRDSFALLVIMTPDASESKYVTYEWACALGARIPVIPIMLQPAALHPRLDILQYMAYIDESSFPWDDLIDLLKDFEYKSYFSIARKSENLLAEIEPILAQLVTTKYFNTTEEMTQLR